MNKKNMLLDTKEYLDLLDNVKSKVSNTQYRIAANANKELILLYWEIGKIINEKKEWGNKFIDTLATDIKREFPKIVGFSVRNLKNMAKFASIYTECTFVQTVSAQISWSHNLELLKIDNKDERTWYIEKIIKEKWSFRTLQHQIESDVYKRQVTIEKTTNFDVSLEEPQSSLAKDLIKDPYVFDFIAVRKGALERAIENELVSNVTKFLLELGSGFTFVGQQYPIQVGDKDFYIDLLFYHLDLSCYVVIELKATEFIPEFVGKLNFYVNVVDGEMRRDGDNPTIGILLCKNKDRLIAEYALKNIISPIGVAEYSISEILPDDFIGKLPSIEDIEARLLKDFQAVDQDN